MALMYNKSLISLSLNSAENIVIFSKDYYRQLNGLFWGHAQKLRYKATVQSRNAFMSYDLLEAVEAVAVHQLTDVGPSSLKGKY